MRRTVTLIALAAALAGSSAGCGGPASSPQIPPPPEHPDVLLVTVDTFRADRAGAHGDPRGLTPHLDRIARRGLQARHGFVPAPITAVSHASVLTALDPPRHGVRENTSYVLPQSLPTLAERLREAGFVTGACIAALPLESRFGFAHGFDFFDEDLGAASNARTHYAERPAADVVDAALRWVETRRRSDRLFLWTHFFDPHEPHAAPRPFRLLPWPAYDQEIRAMDAEIGRLLRSLRERRGGLPWIAVISDHGESLGEHGETTHGVLVNEPTMRAFLAFAPPDPAPAAADALPRGLLDAVARSADIAPTLLAAVGADGIPDADGRSLLAGAAPTDGAYGESYYSSIQFRWAPLLSWRDERWTYVEGARVALYDRSVDPGETRNVAEDHPDVAQRLAARLRPRLVAPEAPSGPELDDATREQLMALGYVSGGGGPSIAWDPEKDPRDLIGAANSMFRGVLLMGEGRAQDALPRFQRAYRSDPTNANFLFHLAGCLRELGDLPSALDYYRRTIEVDPTFAIAYAHLAVLEFDRGRRNEAMDLLATALELQPGSFPILMSAGDLSADLGRGAEAVEYYTRASAAAPGRPESWAKLAEAAEARGDARAAREFWDRAIACDAGHPLIPERVK